MARCEHKSVRRAIAQGRLVAFQPTNKLLIREGDAEAWIESKRAVTTGAEMTAKGGRPRLRAKASHGPGSVAELREIERKAVHT